MTQQLFALIVGEAKAQAQGLSDTPNDSVACSVPAPLAAALAGAARPVAVASVLDGDAWTDVAYAPDRGRELTLRVNRVLPARSTNSADLLGHLAADRALPDGATVRDLLFTLLGSVARH